MERVKYEMVALYDKPCNMFNVGCMMAYMDYTPRTFEEITQKINKYECPKCGHENVLMNDRYKYCPDCSWATTIQ